MQSVGTVGRAARADIMRIYRDIEGTTPLPRQAPLVCQPEPSESARQALADLVERGTVRIQIDLVKFHKLPDHSG